MSNTIYANTIYANTKEDFEERALFQDFNGVTMDLTGTYTANMKVAKYYNSTPIVTITGAVETPATSGIVKYTATASQMSVLGYGTHVYTRYLYDSTGKAISVVSGSFVIVPTV